MKSWTKQQRETYTATMDAFMKDAPHINYHRMAEILSLLHRNNTALNRFNDEYASTEMTPRETKAMEKRESEAENRVRKLVNELGFSVKFSGDPRGNAIQISLPSKRSNSWDGLTWGLNW